MDRLTLYLGKNNIIPPQKITCCSNDENIILSSSLQLYTCKICGCVKKDYLYEINYYDKFKNPNILKTYIPYQYKFKHLHRLNKWGNYSYKEVQLYKLLEEIDSKLKNFKRDEIDFTKILFSQLYDKLSIRAKIKDALIVYCLFRTMLFLKRKVEIDDLLLLFNITIKNYLDLNKKIIHHKLIYLKEMQSYIKLSKHYIDKNQLIQLYSLFITYNKRKFNNKSILLGLIHFKISQNKNFDAEHFFSTFNISKVSIRNVNKFIIDNNIILNDIRNQWIQ